MWNAAKVDIAEAAKMDIPNLAWVGMNLVSPLRLVKFTNESYDWLRPCQV